MASINKFGKKRLEYLKSRHPQVLRKLREHGILESHLLYTQARAVRHMDRLMSAGFDEFEAEEIALQGVIMI